jgi:hypothetical protein
MEEVVAARLVAGFARAGKVRRLLGGACLSGHIPAGPPGSTPFVLCVMCAFS